MGVSRQVKSIRQKLDEVPKMQKESWQKHVYKSKELRNLLILGAQKFPDVAKQHAKYMKDNLSDVPAKPAKKRCKREHPESSDEDDFGIEDNDSIDAQDIAEGMQEILAKMVTF